MDNWTGFTPVHSLASNVMVSDEDQRTQQNSELLSQIAASEFNLEIGLRERVTQTLNARIAWAMLMRDSLQTGELMLLSLMNSSLIFLCKALKPVR